MQTIWFIIAFRKRHELDKPNKRGTLTNLRKKITVFTDQITSLIISGAINNKIALSYDDTNSNENLNIPINSNPKRMMSSFYKFEDKTVIRIRSHTDKPNNANKNINSGKQLNENLQKIKETPTLSTIESSDKSISTNFEPINSDGGQQSSYVCINMSENDNDDCHDE